MNEGSGRYDLTLERHGRQVTGTFEGSYGEEPAKGKVLGHIHRWVTSTRV
jgi:hypothetical protein